MRRSLPVILAIVVFAAVPAAAQIKQPRPKNPDDEGLHYVVLREFGKLNTRFDELSNKVTALENELARLKQQNADLSTEIRGVQTTAKGSEQKLSDQLLSTERTLITITRDLVQMRSDMTSLLDQVKRSQLAAVPAGGESSAGSTLEGYIMEVVGEREVKVSLGAGHGIRAGARLAVFAAADPKTQIGQLVVTEVLDANNSRAEIILKSPGATFNFSDIVRPIS